MCNQHPVINNRRQFLRLATVGAGALMLAGTLPATMVHAAPTPAPVPKPSNSLEPKHALARLMEGNHRYVEGVTKRHDFINEREALTSGQNPFAAVLGCADSRIAPEYAFDTGRGDLFAVRVAGNFVTDDGLASLEYAVVVLGTPLIMVLGHQRCGAISAGVQAARDNTQFPGHIQGLAEALKPSVNKVLNAPGDLLENATTQNVIDTVAQLKSRSSLLADAITQGKLQIVGGIYELDSGKVKLIS